MSYKDKRIADEAGSESKLMCSANGCPNLWSTDNGHLCRWHADAPTDRWPSISENMRWLETERARKRVEPKPFIKPLTIADKREILAKLKALPSLWASRAPKWWATQLKDKESRGEALNEIQRKAWRAALGEDKARE